MSVHSRPVLGSFLLTLVIVLPLANVCPAADPPQLPASPLAPAESLKHFRLPDDLKIELVAAEPNVVDPVAIRFDELGRIWVAEMSDYPTGPTPGGNQKSRIRVLEDRNRDGQYETSTVFAEGRSFVTGLQPWKGGVIVTESGKVAYLKDENGDGRVDREETWFTGFLEGNTQLRANHPRLGLDNRVYIANGLRGGSVVDHRHPDSKPISINGMDFRFDPLGGTAEAVSGAAQFGLAFDDFGNRFVCSNRNPVKQIVIEDRYLKASPTVAVPAVSNDVAAFAENSRIFPLTRAWTTSNLHAGQFTAACGVFIYRGEALPAEYRGNAFTCDPTGNLIHREILTPAGPTFIGRPAYADRDWLASTDEWFRPVSMELGPDGALYVVDMYRAVIEHPEFMPDELKTRPDLRLGDDSGRIYRITAKNHKSSTEIPSFASRDDLLAALRSSNAWQRDTAHRLILERGLLAPSIAEASASQSSEAWANALWLGASKADLEQALSADDPRVRRQAILAAEGRLASDTGLRDLVRRRLSDSDQAVRFQTLLTLTLSGGCSPDEIAASIPAADFDDPWLRSAIELATGERAGELFSLLLKRTNDQPGQGEQALLASLVARSIALGKQPAAQQALRDIFALSSEKPSNAALTITLVESAARSAKARGLSLKAIAGDDANLANSLSTLHASAVKIATEPEADEAAAKAAIALLAHFPETSASLATFIRESANQPLRIAAIGALAQTADVETWRSFIDELPQMTPANRRAVLEASLGPTERATLILDALTSGRLKPAELDLLQANRLRQHRDPAIRDRAAKLLATGTAADRVAALETYQAALKLNGDPLRGRTVFEKNCSTCHRVGDVGVNVAPDISDSRTKTAAQLLADIVQPNRAIDNNYIAYNVLLADGTSATGILASESTTSITLRQPGDKTIVVPRSEVEELRSSGVSLMPDGLEKNIDLQSMADLLAYVKNWRYLDGKTPLGK